MDGFFSRGRNFTHLCDEFFTFGNCQYISWFGSLDWESWLFMKLPFIDHISMVIDKPQTIFVFMKRWATEFIDPYITKLLHISLARLIMRNASIIWNSYYRCHSDSIEFVQKQFLLFCLRGLGWDCANGFPSYDVRLGFIKLQTFERRRTVLGLCFVFNRVKGDIDSEFLLSNLNFSIPARFSSIIVLFLDFYRTNYGCNFPFRRLCIDFRWFVSVGDLCCCCDYFFLIRYSPGCSMFVKGTSPPWSSESGLGRKRSKKNFFLYIKVLVNKLFNFSRFHYN